jgi:general secretion pathway protein C
MAVFNNILELFSEHNRRIASIISIVVIVMMSLSVANTVLFVMENLDSSSDRLIAPSTATGGKTARPSYKISDLELFGKLEETQSTPQVVDAPETKLNLELQGVFISEEEKRSTAIVGEKGKAGELYEIGDKLPGNATLAAVLQDHVLIRRGSRMEKLMFSDSKFRVSGSQAQTATTSASRQSKLTKVRERIRNSTTSTGNGTRQPALANSGSGPREALSRYSEKLLANPAGALTEIGVSPVSGDGNAKGYRIGAEAESSLRQAGLQPGDIILSVNGRPVGNAANDTALMQQVMASSRVRVEVQRGQRKFFLTVPVPK